MIIGDWWMNNGFRISIEYFLSRGYTKAELYGSMYQYADVPHEYQHFWTSKDAMQVRKFIEAVLDYTGADQIDVITHSMGVGYGRRVIKGGMVQGDFEPYYIGKPIADRINTFIGIAGRNWGSADCNQEYEYNNWKVCNKLNGAYPGTNDSSDMSTFLAELNENPIKEGDHTYAILSMYDNPVTFGKLTSEWPTMDDSYIYDDPKYDHLATRDLSVEIQYNLVTYHSFDAPSECFL